MTAFNNDIIYKPELLAPAGGKESFFGVLRAGADAVYLAGEHYGARAYAENFSNEELENCIRYAHLYGKKVYITINTLIKNSETDDLISFVKPFYESGVDGVIVQDIGIISIIKKNFPYLEIHASTQMSITTTYGAEFLKGMGVTRVVPARELSLAEIKRMKAETGLELECFIHGAMCYSYSGQCLFSSCIGLRSGNRGKCAQPCRLPYKVDGKEIYPLSMKDMCTLNILDKLIDAGIDSFKIEGRMKKPEYAAGVTAIYRKYIDRYFVNKSLDIDPEDIRTLEDLYIRSEISDGYYDKYNGKSMITITSPSYKGAEDYLLNRIRSDYLSSSPQKGLKPFMVDFEASFVEGKNAAVTAKCGDFKATVMGDVVETAKNSPISRDDVIKSLKKLGNTVFEAEESSFENVTVSERAYYPLKGINELRRRVLSELENQIAAVKKDIPENISDYIESSKINNVKISHNVINKSEKFNVLVASADQIRALSPFSDFIGRIYVPEDLILREGESFIKNVRLSADTPVFCALPYMRRYKDIALTEKMKELASKGAVSGFLVRNLEDLTMMLAFKEKNPDIILVCDHTLYIWNDHAIKHLGIYADSLTLPIELSMKEHRTEALNAPHTAFEKMIYGRFPLMQSANCLLKTCFECRKKDISKRGFIYIKDRTGRMLPVYPDCEHCNNTIYNAVVYSAYDLDKAGLSDNVTFRIDFTDEDYDNTSNVMRYYTRMIGGENPGKPTWEYTTGFDKKSTE